MVTVVEIIFGIGLLVITLFVLAVLLIIGSIVWINLFGEDGFAAFITICCTSFALGVGLGVMAGSAIFAVGLMVIFAFLLSLSRVIVRGLKALRIDTGTDDPATPVHR